MLEPIYEQIGELARLVEVQRIQLGHEKETDKRVALLLRIGELAGKLGDAEQAFDAYAARLRRDPASRPAREALETSPASSTTGQQLVALYEKALSSKGKGSSRPRSSASSCWSSRSPTTRSSARPSRAVEYFRRAQSIEPEDASALVALERLYTRTERWSDLVDTLLEEGAAASTTRTSARRSTIRIAHVWEEMLGNVEQAIVAWNVVLAGQPGNLQALRALDRLYLAARQ